MIFSRFFAWCRDAWWNETQTEKCRQSITVWLNFTNTALRGHTIPDSHRSGSSLSMKKKSMTKESVAMAFIGYFFLLLLIMNLTIRAFSNYTNRYWYRAPIRYLAVKCMYMSPPISGRTIWKTDYISYILLPPISYRHTIPISYRVIWKHLVVTIHHHSLICHFTFSSYLINNFLCIITL